VAKKGVGVVIAKAVGLAALTIVIGTGAVHAVRSRTVSDAMPTTRATSATIAAAPASAAVPDEPPAPAPSSAPVAVPQSVIARAAAPRSTSSAAVTVGDPNDDVTLVQNAQSALPTDPARTLALCAEHARRFPNGLMAQEREVLAIGALAKTGRLGDARARANKFAATYPTSTHLPRIHAVLGDAP
jgi:hypothetical protein